MSDPNDTPSTEELAEELAATEGDNATETAPDPAEPEAPAEPTPQEPAAPTPEPPAPTPEPEAEPTPEPREIAPPSSAQAEKKAAEGKRRKKVIDAAERPAEVDPEEEKRKNAIREEMQAVTADRDALLGEAQGCQDRLAELSAELYPHAAKSDTLVDAVRGHIKAQKRIRANRQSNPARIAEILKAAGKAPIDAAFHRQRARGMSRPTRTQITPEKPAQGDGSDANAGSE